MFPGLFLTSTFLNGPLSWHWRVSCSSIPIILSIKGEKPLLSVLKTLVCCVDWTHDLMAYKVDALTTRPPQQSYQKRHHLTMLSYSESQRKADGADPRLPAFSPFSSVFQSIRERNHHFSNLTLLSANAFNMVQSKISSFGKELTLPLLMMTKETLVDSVDRDQTAQNHLSTLSTFCILDCN